MKPTRLSESYGSKRTERSNALVVAIVFDNNFNIFLLQSCHAIIKCIIVQILVMET